MAAPAPPAPAFERLSLDGTTAAGSVASTMQPLESTASKSSSVLPSIPNPLRSLSNFHSSLASRCAEKKGRRRKASEDYALNGTQPSCELFNVFKALAEADEAGDNLDHTTSHSTDASIATNGAESEYADSSSMLAGDKTPRPNPSLAAESSPASSVYTSNDGLAAQASHRRNSILNADRDAAIQADRADNEAVNAAAAAAGTDSEAVKAWLRSTVSKNQTIGQRYAAVGAGHGGEATDAEADARAAAAAHAASHAADGFESDSSDEWYNADDAVCRAQEAAQAKMSAPLEQAPDKPSIVDMPPHLDLTNMTEDQVHSLFRRAHIPPEKKLEVIQAEFGDIASKFVNDEGVIVPERILAESQGSLFKGVMMIGNLHLTTHRLVFHALLPPDDLGSPPKDSFPDQTEDEAMAKDSRPNVIIAGPVNMHRSNPLKRQRRVWLELTADMLTTYPSADEAGRVRPLHSILLTSILKLSPYDESQPLDFYIKYWSSIGEHIIHFSVDNDMSGIRWRRYFEAVLFRHARERFRESHRREVKLAGDETVADLPGLKSQWGLLRCCVPFDRAVLRGIGEYHSFATLINIDVALDDDTKVTWHPEELAKGNYDASYHKISALPQLPGMAGPTNVSSSSGHSSPTRSRSLRKVLPSFKLGGKKDSNSRESSPQRSPLSHTFTQDDQADHSPPSSPITSGLPPRLRTMTRLSIQKSHKTEIEPDVEENVSNTFNFLIAVLNNESWFASKVTDALTEAHRWHHVQGAEPTKMVLDVGGYDCLAGDDEDASSIEEDDDDDEGGKPAMVVEQSKAQKAAMAARVFGLREDEGIWLKRCYVQHNHLLARGHMIISPRFICFWRRATIGADIKYRFSTHEVKGAQEDVPLRPRLHGIKLHIQGHHDLRIQMFSVKGRNELMKRLNEASHVNPPTPTTPALSDSGASTPTTSGPMRTDTETTMGSMASVMTIPSAAAGDSDDSSPPETPPTTPPTSVQPAEERWSTQIKSMKESPPDFDINPAVIAHGGLQVLKAAADILAPPPDMLLYPKSMSEQALSYMPFVANYPWSRNLGWNVRLTARTFTMLTIGSRGDVQPYIALGVRLMQDGHKVVIVTHDEFKHWIEGYGIEHRQAGGDPTALMKLSTDHKMFSPGFFKEALSGFRSWLDQLLLDSWHACQDADVLIESPSAMAGVHIAEALKIPYFRAFTMPWTRTSAYPQAFMVPAFEMGPSFNYSSYVLFDNIMWRASSGQINRWRKKTLKLPATDQSSLSISKVPFLYNFSPAVVPKPLDWADDITITGYWNLENSDMDWSPPDTLIAWMNKAKAEGKPIVYIGFGSIVVPDPAAVTRAIIDGVEKSGVRAIVAKGWSSRDAKPGEEDDIAFPPSCYPLDKVPHGWLFPKINAAMHHGGAGTTGASLRAGIPTLIKPWFGDQYFWALRVAKLGAGQRVSSLRVDDISDALKKATTDRVMIEKAEQIGTRIRAESGVDVAVQTINFTLVRAAKNRSKLKKEDNKNRAEAGMGVSMCKA